MRSLSPRQLAVVRAVADTLFAERGGVARDERIAFTLRELRANFVRYGFQTQLAFRGALAVIQLLAPLLLLGQLRRFVHLSPAARARCLTLLEGSRLGLVLVLLKTMLCLHYFEHPEVVARTGYDVRGQLGPAWMQEVVDEPRHKLPLVQRAPEASAAEGA